MESVKTLVIGAGAIGLGIGYELSKSDPDLVIVDKENSFGKHTSSRNSEVIHAGHYYKPGSLKASLCVGGNGLLYRYLEENSIPHKNVGKIIVATSPEEEVILQNYVSIGIQNGCQGLKLLNRKEVNALEPLVKCRSGLLVPSTGIFDTHKFMQSLEKKVEDQDAYIVYGMQVMSMHREHGNYIVEFDNGEKYQCERVVNSAGLWADGVAEFAGMATNELGINQYWCKGEYYKTNKISDIDHLIYPVADPKGVFLGIHLTINLDGNVRFGPNAYYVDQIDYRFNEEYFADFYQSISRYIDVLPGDLAPDDTGIRPKLQGPGEGFRDFYIREETSQGLPGFVNLIGMESPGLTACLAIAKYVASILTRI